jgi:hypothetical protein
MKIKIEINFDWLKRFIIKMFQKLTLYQAIALLLGFSMVILKIIEMS